MQENRNLIILGSVLKYGILLAGAVTMIIPFVDMFLGALKTPAEIIARPPVLIPQDPQWGVFYEITQILPMGKLYFNSIFVTTTVTLAVVLTSSMAGFSLAKYRFPGRDIFFRGILVTMMFPVFLFIIPVYFIMRRFPFVGGNDLVGLGGTGMLQTYGALILPFIVSAYGIFLLRQFIVSLPDDLLDAARIDGCSELRIYAQVIVPLCKPALATLAIFTFINTWNEYIWTMTITTSARHMMTIPVGIQLLRESLDPLRNVALMRAALAVGVIPVMILFISMQRYYVRGIVMSGIKG